MKNISIIAAIGKNSELGYKNDLIWKIKEDLEYFKNKTLDKYIVMGSNTYLSLPRKLKNRKYIILSNGDIKVDDDCLVFNKVEDVLAYICNIESEVFIIGGAMIYKTFIDYTDKMYLTRIEEEFSEADVYFPNINEEEWDIKKGSIMDSENIKYSHDTYVRRRK